MFEKILLSIITLLHILFIIFVVGAPFTNMNYFIFMHALLVPFMVLHWFCNDNTCVLTVVEKYLRKRIQKDKYKEEDCITCKLINPIYDFKKNNKKHTRLIYSICFLVWIISATKLWLKIKNKEITHWTHLYLI